MSAITNFFGALINAITAFFGSIFGIFTKKKNGEFFLEIDSSKEGASVPETATAAPVAAKPAKKKKATTAPQSVAASAAQPVAASAPQAVAAANQALNMPKPKVSTIEPLNIPKFGPARRPGANMKSFLDMAKTVRS